ncbi:MAG: aryl-sulfate sulfotransferase [Saprospiraceae bacterium]|nr:aryl-sulfate sulfotransferase [Saprospiraceae bacterium]
MRPTIYLILLLLSHEATAQPTQRPVPTGVPGYAFEVFDSTVSGYYLATPFRFGVNNNKLSLVILDAQGYLLWYLPQNARNLINFKYHPELELYTYGKMPVGPFPMQYMVLNKDFQVLDSFTTVAGVQPDAHDFLPTSNQSYLVAGAKDSIMDLSAYLFNGVPGSPNTRAVGFVVQEFDVDHNLLFSWNSNDFIHPTEAYGFYGYNANNFDYCHGNTIEEDTDGHLLLSFRHLNSIYKIHRQTGAVLWKLGGKSSSFTFVNDVGFSGQHDARRLPNGNIALFDNANTAPPPRISRAVEYALDTINWTATKVWEYRYQPGFFSPAMGGHQTTETRRHLLSYGLIFRPRPSFVLVDDAGELLSTCFFQDSVMSYRVHFQDLPLENMQRPEIQCSWQNGALTLTAPPGYDQYAWSTGENNTSIVVNAPGIYQLWAGNTNGMVGSEPFQVIDPATACAASPVEEPVFQENQPITGYFDLLGRRLPGPPTERFTGQWYVVQFADGHAEWRLAR